MRRVRKLKKQFATFMAVLTILTSTTLMSTARARTLMSTTGTAHVGTTIPDPASGAINPSYRVSNSSLLYDDRDWQPIVPPEPREVDEMEDATAVEIYDRATGEVIDIPSDDQSQQPVETGSSSTPPYEGLLPSGVVPETVLPPDDRVRITPTTTYPWRTICKLFMTAADDTHWIGSGAIIGSPDGHGYHVLTAGHCVYMHDHGGWISDVEVVPAYDDGYMPYYNASWTLIRTYTGWTQDADHRHDWAVITLDRNVGDYTGWMDRMTADPSDPVYTGILNTAGYPADLDSGECMYFDADYGRTATEHNHWYYMDTYGGQSGSPVWVYYAATEERYILTIHAYGDDGSGSNHGTRLNQDKFDRIITWCNEDTPPTDYADLIDDGQLWSGFSPTTVAPGESFLVWCDIRNIGTAPSGDFYVSYYASTNTIISTSDYLIGTDYVPSIDPFSWADSEWSGTFPSSIPAGTYWIGWIIDSGNDVTEFDEDNNVAYKDSYQLTVSARPRIKIGVIGPMGWPQFTGMQEGAILARDWINGPGGGIVIDGTRYDVSLHFGDEHSVDQRPDLGMLEMERLITAEEVDSIVGGFRSENVFAMREVAMDYNKLFFICGAATNELVDCGAGTCGACVRCDYDRYRYLFRVMPVNDTTLLLNLLGFLRWYVLPARMVPLYDDPVNTAVIAEDLEWTVDKYNALVYGGYLGPQADIVYSARTSKHETDFSPHLNAMHAAEVRLIVHLFSTPSGIAFISQWAAHPIKAVPVGINVLSQTGLTSEYETILAASGTRTPISITSQPYTTVEFWDLYLATFGRVPIYTSFGAYDAIIAMHDLLEAQTGPTYIHPPFDTADADALVPIIEATDRESVLGRFRYTQFHDPFSNEYGPTWTQGYVRPLVVQWQAGRLEVVWPMDQPYSKYWALPDETGSMYPYPSDVLQDGGVGLYDALMVRGCFGTVPGDPMWFMVADVVRDNLIDIFDALAVRLDYGKSVALPLAYCDEAGHMS